MSSQECDISAQGDDITALITRRPVVAALFALPALSLAGLPPFSGFVVKLALVDAGIDQAAIGIVVVALVVSLLTLLSMTKIWMGVFWGEDDGGTSAIVDSPAKRSWIAMSSVTASAVGLTLTIALLAGPLWNITSPPARCTLR